MGIKFILYATSSAALAAATVMYAVHTRQQFYPTGAHSWVGPVVRPAIGHDIPSLGQAPAPTLVFAPVEPPLHAAHTSFPCPAASRVLGHVEAERRDLEQLCAALHAAGGPLHEGCFPRAPPRSGEGGHVRPGSLRHHGHVSQAEPPRGVHGGGFRRLGEPSRGTEFLSPPHNLSP